jgi:hypothetical protein
MSTNNGKPWNALSQELEYERHPRPPTLQKIGSAPARGDYCNAHADDEPFVEHLTGWRLATAWILFAVVPWLVLYGIGRVLYDLVLAWPDVVEMLTW